MRKSVSQKKRPTIASESISSTMYGPTSPSSPRESATVQNGPLVIGRSRRSNTWRLPY